MGLRSLYSALFGGGRNVIAETAEVFRVNAEASDARSHAAQADALAQFAAEFGVGRSSWFDSLVDGLNRLPRPAMAFGVIALFVSAMVDPVWFAERMVGLQAVPEPLWYILGAIVSFFFGARELHKHRSLQAAPARQLVEEISALRSIEQKADAAQGSVSEAPSDPQGDADRNPALDAILRKGRGQ